jgi:hypothetical protein
VQSNALREENGRLTTKHTKHTKEFNNREEAMAARTIVLVDALQISLLSVFR